MLVSASTSSDTTAPVGLPSASASRAHSVRMVVPATVDSLKHAEGNRLRMKHTSDTACAGRGRGLGVRRVRVQGGGVGEGGEGQRPRAV